MWHGIHRNHANWPLSLSLSLGNLSVCSCLKSVINTGHDWRYNQTTSDWLQVVCALDLPFSLVIQWKNHSQTDSYHEMV